MVFFIYSPIFSTGELSLSLFLEASARQFISKILSEIAGGKRRKSKKNKSKSRRKTRKNRRK